MYDTPTVSLARGTRGLMVGMLVNDFSMLWCERLQRRCLAQLMLIDELRDSKRLGAAIYTLPVTTQSSHKVVITTGMRDRSH